MSVEDAARHFAALARLGVPAAGIHIGGGEPFMDFPRLLAIVQAARAAGLAGVGYVETNGFWATSPPIVRERLAALAEAGMLQLSISADPYHQEFVPPDRVQLLHQTARSVLGPGGVRARRWKWLKEARDVSVMDEAARQELFRTFLRQYPERMSGRAATHLAPLAARCPVDALPRDGCRRALLESGHVHVDPEGWVYPGTCAGIVLGRAGPELPLDALLGGWRLEDSPLVAALAEGGPTRLLEPAAGGGFLPDPAGYAGKCHLCWSLRCHLAGSGEEDNSLRPASLYLTS
jgi:MoaA/NifB/PqqE/SkfB family radical SAM enzyme